MGLQLMKHKLLRLVRHVADDKADLFVHHPLIDIEVIVRIPEMIVAFDEQIRLFQIQYFPIKMQNAIGIGFFRGYVIPRFDIDAAPRRNR